MLEEPQYLQIVDRTFRTIIDAFEDVDPDEVDVYTAGDVLTLAFPTGVKCVINTQRPLRQVWLAAKSRAWHFAYDTGTNTWLDDKGTGAELFATIRSVVTENGGPAIAFA